MNAEICAPPNAVLRVQPRNNHIAHGANLLASSVLTLSRSARAPGASRRGEGH